MIIYILIIIAAITAKLIIDNEGGMW